MTTIGLICKRKKMLCFYTTISSCYGGWANCLPLRAWICTTGVSLGILIYGCNFQSCDPLHPLSFNNILELLKITWVQIEPSSKFMSAIAPNAHSFNDTPALQRDNWKHRKQMLLSLCISLFLSAAVILDFFYSLPTVMDF